LPGERPKKNVVFFLSGHRCHRQQEPGDNIQEGGKDDQTLNFLVKSQHGEERKNGRRTKHIASIMNRSRRFMAQGLVTMTAK
jgi:hypothetical protein